MPELVIDTLAFVAGIAIIAWILWDVYQTVIVPRPTPTRIRLARFVTRGMWRLWTYRSGRASSSDRRERMLGGFAPLVVVTLLICWVSCLIVGYGLVLFAFSPEFPSSPDLGSAVYQAGVTLLTIGYGDVTATGGPARIAELAAGATGLAVLGLGVTYLFSLYTAFQRREELVTTLDARAGAPPSGIQLLETHAKLELWDDLRRTLQEWELWSARVLDTHIAYPVLAYFRSSHDGESWLGAQGAVLDAAALLATTVESGPGGQPVPRGQAIMTLKGGAHLVEDLANFWGFSDDDVPMVTRAEFDAARRRLQKKGLIMRADADTAWHAFADIRSPYASRLNKLAGYLLIPPTQWIGDRSAVRHVTRVELAFRTAMTGSSAGADRAGGANGFRAQPIAYLDDLDEHAIPLNARGSLDEDQLLPSSSG